MEEKEALYMVESSLKISNNRYEVCIPWKKEASKIKTNYNMAVKRLCCTERKLGKDACAADEYGKIIKEYVRKGYVRKLPSEEEVPEKTWYLPHFAVLQPDKVTTKTRIVFDGSAKYNNKSLNDIIHQGPKLQNDLFNVLLRFRKHPVAVVSDVSEMYLQIQVKNIDRPFLRFLWRDMELTRPPDRYEFERLVFGMNSSPFEAQFVVKHRAESCGVDLPLAAESVLESTYIDDTMDSVPDDHTAITLYHQLTELWKGCGMHARKWISNS